MPDRQDIAAILQALRQAQSSQQLDAWVRTEFTKLSRIEQQSLIEHFRQLSDEKLQRSLEPGKAITLRHLREMPRIAVDDLKVLTIGALYFISHPDERLRLLDSTEFQRIAGQNAAVQRLLPLFIAYYLSIEMPRSAEGIILFAIPLHDEIRSCIDHPEAFGGLKLKIEQYRYSDEEFARIREGLLRTIEQHITSTYAGLGQTINVRREVVRASVRTSARGAAWVLLFILATNAHFPSFSGWWRKNAKEYAKESVQGVYEKYEHDLKQQQGLSGVTPELFNQGKADLEKSLAAMYEEYERNIDDTRGVVVTMQEDVNATIERVFKDERLIASIRDLSIEFVNRLGALFSEAYVWKSFAEQEKHNFERDVHATIHQLFTSKQFLAQLELDKKNGLYKVEVTKNMFAPYFDRGLYWSTYSGMAGARWLAQKALSAIVAVMRDFLVQAYNLIAGTLFHNQQQVTDAKNYFGVLAALAGGAAALLAVLLIAGGPWIFGILQYVRMACKFTWRGGKLFYKIMIEGAIRDTMVISGVATLSEVSANGSIEYKTLWRRIAGNL
jgi:hypothetical protein